MIMSSLILASKQLLSFNLKMKSPSAAFDYLYVYRYIIIYWIVRKVRAAKKFKFNK